MRQKNTAKEKGKMIKFSELKHGDLFNYDSSQYKKAENGAHEFNEGDPDYIKKDTWIFIPPDTLVEKIKPTRPERERK